MITLYQPKPIWGLPSMSPFAVKLETYFKMTKVEYKSRAADIRKAPLGRMPYIEIDGKLMGDSTLIINHFKKKFGDPLDQNLSREQRALALAIQALFEDRMYFATAWLRWSQDDSFNYVGAYFKPFLPPVIGGFILGKIRKSFLKDLKTHGIGDHRKEDIIELAKNGLTALSDLLGDKPYFLGSEPTSIDATAYGFLIQLIWVPWESPAVVHARSLKNLVSYCERMKSRYWS
jgi:glutathione S-transferase